MHKTFYSNHLKSEHPKTGKLDFLVSEFGMVNSHLIGRTIWIWWSIFWATVKYTNKSLTRPQCGPEFKWCLKSKSFANRTYLHLLNTGLVQYLGSVYTKCICECSDLGHLVFKWSLFLPCFLIWKELLSDVPDHSELKLQLIQTLLTVPNNNILKVNETLIDSDSIKSS